jgi:hypothetical protein
MSKQMEKRKNTQFTKGTSGNPLGRPKGAKNKSTLLREAMQQKADRLLSKEVPKVLAVVIAAAKAGDMSAAKMILDRAVPVKKADDGAEDSGKQLVSITIQNLTSPHETSGVTINGEVVADSTD